jgi:Calpain family cysteine protease
VGIWAILDIDEALPFYKKMPEDQKIKKNDKDFNIDHLKKILETKFLGAYSSKNNLWVSYLEKAYAKLNEGYFNICNNGFSRHSLTDLTSAPSRTYNLTKDKMTVKKLVELVGFY